MDTEKLEQLIQVVNGAEISEISLESDGAMVKIRKARPAPARSQGTSGSKKPVKTAGTVKPAQSTVPEKAFVSAPMVGIFHSFNGAIGVGTVIRSGQIVGSIESMKLMNEIAADVDGRVEEVLVEDGMPVEYGQALLRLACE